MCIAPVVARDAVYDIKGLDSLEADELVQVAAQVEFAARAKATWARLMRKVYAANPLECPKCRSVKKRTDARHRA